MGCMKVKSLRETLVGRLYDRLFFEVRVLEPGPEVQVTTNDGSHLFVPVDVMDHTYSGTLRMQESDALELSNPSGLLCMYQYYHLIMLFLHHHYSIHQQEH